jgi:hypothetical protein
MDNLEFLKNAPDFDTFADMAISAKKRQSLEKLETLKKH